MSQGKLTGVRIRDRRLDRAISQTDLARAVGISPSYLNLIEHSRRRIGGKLLNDIARALTLDPAVLTDAPDPGLMGALELAAASAPEAGAELPQAEPFAARYPGWAATVAAQTRRLAELEERVAALTDRLAHDPHLDTALHEVISVVSSIRSTASILVSEDAVDPDWQNRFHRNLHADGQRLAEASQALASYLDAPKTGEASVLSPREEVARLAETLAYHVPELEAGGGSWGKSGGEDGARNGGDGDGGKEGAHVLEAVLARMPVTASAQGRAMARDWLRAYARDAALLPMDRLAEAAQAAQWDPGRAAQALGCDLGLVMRRMAALPDAPGRPQLGYAQCDQAGAVLELRPIAGFALPRTGPACPLWPMFEALARPGQPIRAVVEMPGSPPRRLTCYAVATPAAPPAFDTPVLLGAAMLVVADAPPAPARPVGRTCRVCPRPDCPARREPSILPSPPAPELADL